MSQSSAIEWTEATSGGRALDGRTWDEMPEVAHHGC